MKKYDISELITWPKWKLQLYKIYTALMIKWLQFKMWFGIQKLHFLGLFDDEAKQLYNAAIYNFHRS